jgi:hypothetical protein
LAHKHNEKRPKRVSFWVHLLKEQNTCMAASSII